MIIMFYCKLKVFILHFLSNPRHAIRALIIKNVVLLMLLVTMIICIVLNKKIIKIPFIINNSYKFIVFNKYDRMKTNETYSENVNCE